MSERKNDHVIGTILDIEKIGQIAAATILHIL